MVPFLWALSCKEYSDRETFRAVSQGSADCQRPLNPLLAAGAAPGHGTARHGTGHPPGRSSRAAPGERPAPGRSARELPLPARTGTRGRGGAPAGRGEGGRGSAGRGGPRGTRQHPGGSGRRGGSAGLRRARRRYLRAGGRPFPRAGRGPSLRSPAAPRALTDYFGRGTGHRSLRSPPQPARRCESPASLQAPRRSPPTPLPAPHSACQPGLINLIHLELIVFTFVSSSPPTSPPPPSCPPFPSGRGLGPGRGPWSGSGWRGAERLRFEPRQRHLSSTGQCRAAGPARGRDRTGRDGPPVGAAPPPRPPRSRPVPAAPAASRRGAGETRSLPGCQSRFSDRALWEYR
ncbi:translation initiation factor IF-2-like [Manacus candei]|uniref:translation initiation factor IF-2-like n=1 Tax=Manacus candei TaxID=415023 RepID=UPI002227BEC1|nr:translation initiation factor IF-2-like [Manacus candei]